MNTLGHLNPMIGFAQMLHPKHHIIFAVSQKSKGVPSYYGFQEEVYEVDNPFFNVDKKEMKKINEEKKIFGNNNGMQRWKLMVDEEVLLNMTKSVNPKVKQVVDKIQPDLVVVDVAFCIPSAIRNYPWIHLITSNPSMVMLDERCPPPGLGKLKIFKTFINY